MRPELGPGRVVAHGRMAQEHLAGRGSRPRHRSRDVDLRKAIAAPRPRPAAASTRSTSRSRHALRRHRAQSPRPCVRRRRRRPTGGDPLTSLAASSRTASAVTPSMRSIELGRLDQPVEQQQLARHLLGAGRRALQPHQQAGLELRLGARQLGLRRLLGGGAHQLLRRRRRSACPSSPARSPRGCRTGPYRPAPSSSNRSRSRGRGAPAPPGTAATTCPRRTAPRTPGRCRTPAAR